LEDVLVEQGLVMESVAPGMAMELSRLETKPLPDGLEVRPVEDMNSLEHCINITADVFGIPAESKDAWGQIIKAYGLGPPHKWFVGYLNGVPVSASLLVLHKNVAGIYNVATLQEARGKGIGTALTCLPLQFAKDSGYKVAVLEASEMGLPVYKKLGFEKICDLRIFIWTPEEG
jgi:GNAT superfamily N-acetyltransferase